MSDLPLSPNSVESPAPLLSEGPGAILKQAREACRLSVEEVAQQLRLGTSLIHSLENNEFDQIKALAYTQGYLNAYARLVKAPIEAVLDSFYAMDWVCAQTQEASRSVQPQWAKSTSLPGNTTRLGVWIALAVGVVVLIAIALWWDARQPPPKEAITPMLQQNTSLSLPSSAVVEEPVIETSVVPSLPAIEVAPAPSFTQKKSRSGAVIEDHSLNPDFVQTSADQE